MLRRRDWHTRTGHVVCPNQALHIVLRYNRGRAEDAIADVDAPATGEDNVFAAAEVEPIQHNALCVRQHNLGIKDLAIAKHNTVLNVNHFDCDACVAVGVAERAVCEGTVCVIHKVAEGVVNF